MRPHESQHARPPFHHQLPELTQTHVHRVNDTIQPSHPLLSPSPPTCNLSCITVFSNVSVLPIRWPKHWHFSFIIISPSKEYSGLIFFRVDWFDLLAVQGTLKSLIQHHSSKASILRCSAFFYNPTLTSIQGEGNGNPLQYSCLENPMDRGAW